MAKDILTIRQLEAQLARRQERLRQLTESGAPEAAIELARKDLQLTRRRLERAREADYEEEMVNLQQMGE